MPSFDVISELDWSEVQNALNQTQKELSQRFDFRGTNATVEKTEQGILLTASEEDRVRAARDVLEEKLVRRKLSLKHFDPQDPEPAAKGASKMLIKTKEGIDRDHGREIIKRIKDSKLKVQAAIHEQSVRVSGKKKDDLQQVMKLLREADMDVELSFKNFRD